VIATLLGREHRYPEDADWVGFNEFVPDLSYDNAFAYNIIKNINKLRQGVH
jgi:hypothetical protein